MSPNSLAAKLLSFRNTTSLMVPGMLVNEIGADAMQDALSRGWLVPDTDTGFLSLSHQATQLQEMRDLAQGVPATEEPVKVPQNESRAAAFRHAVRNLHEGPLGYSGSSSSGGAPGSGQPAPAPAVPPLQPPSAPINPAAPVGANDYMVGEDVVVAQEGKSYQAKVASKNSDGTYKLSFGPNKPVQQDKAFRKEELQRIQGDPNGQPAALQ